MYAQGLTDPYIKKRNFTHDQINFGNYIYLLCCIKYNLHN